MTENWNWDNNNGDKWTRTSKWNWDNNNGDKWTRTSDGTLILEDSDFLFYPNE